MAGGSIWSGIRGWFGSDDPITDLDGESRVRSRSESRQARAGGKPQSSGIAMAYSSEDSFDGGSSEFAGGSAAALDAAALNFVTDAADVTDEADLLEFLAADLDPVPADPVFRDRLRDELWELVLAQNDGHDRKGS